MNRKEGSPIKTVIMRKATDVAIYGILGMSVLTTINFFAVTNESWNDGLERFAQESGHSWIYRRPDLPPDKRPQRIARETFITNSLAAAVLLIRKPESKK